MKKELQLKDEEMKKRVNDAVIKERKNLTTRQKMEIENLRKQHQKEIDVIKNFIPKIFINPFFRQFKKLLQIQLMIDHVLNH